jgi:hypothetical protein
MALEQYGVYGLRDPSGDILEHYGVKGMKWGIRKDRKVQRDYLENPYTKEEKARIKGAVDSMKLDRQYEEQMKKAAAANRDLATKAAFFIGGLTVNAAVAGITVTYGNRINKEFSTLTTMAISGVSSFFKKG